MKLGLTSFEKSLVGFKPCTTVQEINHFRLLLLGDHFFLILQKQIETKINQRTNRKDLSVIRGLSSQILCPTELGNGIGKIN